MATNFVSGPGGDHLPVAFGLPFDHTRSIMPASVFRVQCPCDLHTIPIIKHQNHVFIATQLALT